MPLDEVNPNRYPDTCEQGAKLTGSEPLLGFGDFVFDPEVPLLTYRSRSLEVAPKALNVLSILLKNAGHVVRKDDLLSLVWRDRVVEEANLAVHVSSLRKVFSQNGEIRNCIETVPKRGYRFIAPVRVVARNTGASETSALVDLIDHHLREDTPAAWRKASAIYSRCVELNPVDARARAGIADSLLMRFVPGDVEPEILAGAAANLLAEATDIDPASSDVHLSLSRFHYVWEWNWEGATGQAQHAAELADCRGRQLLAQAWEGFYLALVGDLDRALNQLSYTAGNMALEPLVSYFLAHACYLARDFSRAVAVSTEALEVHPNCWYLHTIMGKALTMLRECSEALRHLRMAKLLNPDDAGLVAAIAWVHATAGNKDQAIRLLRHATTSVGRQPPSFMIMAMAHAAMGNEHSAGNYIEQACAGHDWWVAGLKRDCAFDPLRTQRRFRGLLWQVGL